MKFIDALLFLGLAFLTVMVVGLGISLITHVLLGEVVG